MLTSSGQDVERIGTTLSPPVRMWVCCGGMVVLRHVGYGAVGEARFRFPFFPPPFQAPLARPPVGGFRGGLCTCEV